jgi:DNA-binding NarL/FixJ family response regulator
MIKVIVAEPNALLRDGIVAVLAMERQFEVVAAVAQPRELLKEMAKQPAQIVLFDLPVPAVEASVRFVRQLIEVAPRVRIVLLSMHGGAELINATIEAGAHACVLKREGKYELLRAIAAVLRGGQFRSPEVVKSLRTRVTPVIAPARIECHRALSMREQEVLGMIAAGARTREIASRLSLSTKTIEKHRANLMQKLGLRGVAGVTAYAIQAGILSAGAGAH